LIEKCVLYIAGRLLGRPVAQSAVVYTWVVGLAGFVARLSTWYKRVNVWALGLPLWRATSATGDCENGHSVSGARQEQDAQLYSCDQHQ